MYFLKSLSIATCLMVSVYANTQVFNPYQVIDTIKIDFRNGGPLDSIDLQPQVLSSTLPGGGINTTGNQFSVDFLFYNPSGLKDVLFTPWKKMRFSGLPHIGFAYSFGGNATQFVNTEYQQAFGSKNLINVDYRKLRSNGFLRNSGYSYDRLQVQFNHCSKIFSFETKASYDAINVDYSGGLITDTLTNDFALELIPVWKNNATSVTRLVRLQQMNYLDFASDSLKVFGLFTRHELKIRNRKYSEEDTLYGIYDINNIDTLITNDQYQWSQIKNGAGVVFKNKSSYFKLGSDFNFWNYQNLGLYHDTTELNLFSDFSYRNRGTSIENTFDLNLIGAKNELSNQFNFSQLINRLTLSGMLLVEDKLPDYFQRFAFGNNYTWSTNLTKQQRALGGISAGYKLGNLGVNIKYTGGFYKNNLFYQAGSWIVSTESKLINQFELSGSYTYRALQIQPRYILSLTDSSTHYIPQNQVYLRLILKGGLFKAKKMIGYLGVDASYVSEYKGIRFMPTVGTYEFVGGLKTSKGYANLHFFTGFQIDQFRFYVRFENIGYFWNDKSIEVIDGYIIPSTQLRVGLTWDFFN